MTLDLDEVPQVVRSVPRSSWEHISASSPALGLSPTGSDPTPFNVQLAPEFELVMLNTSSNCYPHGSLYAF